MHRKILKAVLFAFAVIGLVTLMLVSIRADVTLSADLQRVIEAWLHWNNMVWRTLSDWAGFRIHTIFRTAFLVLLFCVSLYFSASSTHKRFEAHPERSRIDILSFVIAFSAITALSFKSIVFSGHGGSARILQGAIGILATGLTIASALPARPHLKSMSKGLWCAIALLVAVLALNFFMLSL